MKPKPYILALEVDYNLKLNLSNGQFEELAVFLDGYEDGRKFANELLASSREDVLTMISRLRIK